ncbi:LysE family translocator [Microbacterium sp. KUDC0406]|uniref:LysE family translocator n=1 Tax=Microbacterium sp. KUDC0406 TaxID=2909588 RepID=UPI001F451E36|nr:LysE family translocator [Microbacterium sp. KUDC0406]UJP09064.1 LysE family translocator [Microbacterium sp. KUDC0406]
MTFTGIAVFCLAAFGLALMPGPNVVFLVTTALTRGPRRAWRSALGVETATLLFAIATAAGLGVVITTSAVLFQLLKWLGVGYLIWLGIQSLRHRPSLEAGVGTGRESWGRAYARGFLLGAANPKVILFFLAFLPQFVDPDHPVWIQLLALGVVFTVIGLLCDLFYCLAAGGVSRLAGSRLSQRRVLRRAPALAYFGLAAWAATTQQRAA